MWNVIRDALGMGPLRTGPRTIVGENIEGLMAFSAQIALDAILEQKEIFEKEMPKVNKLALRFATDEFLVGYAVGVALKFCAGNGRRPEEIPTESLLALLHSKLKDSFPNLDTLSLYRSGSNRVASGILFGINEPGKNQTYTALNEVWLTAAMAYQIAPGLSLKEYAWKNFNMSFEEGFLVGQLGDDVYARYRNQ